MSKKLTKEKKERRRNPRDYTQKSEKEERQALIAERVALYKTALRIPPSINQFNTTLDEDDSSRVLNFFAKYRPENRAEKRERLKKSDPKEGPRPFLVKFGIKHVVELIEQKKAKLVLIAADVNPIEVVVFLPTLCRKMGVSYAFINKKAELGPLVNLKNTSCVCLCETSLKDGPEFKEIIGKCNSIFADNYETAMRHWGGLAMVKKNVNL